ncbi:MAG: PAS domain-containing protein, partial [Cytophagaceae bacterium]
MASALLNDLLTAAQDGVLVYRGIRNTNDELTTLQLTTLNAIAERDSGRSADEQVGKPFTSLFPTGGEEGLLNRYLDVLRTRESIQFEYQCRLASHLSPDRFKVSVIPVENSLVISYQNVTQEKVSEETSFFQQAFDASLSGFAVLKAIRNASGRITDFRLVRFNTAFQKALAPMASDVPNQLITQFVKGGRELGLLSRCIMCVEMGNVHKFELSYNVQNRTHWYQASMTPTGDQMILTITDITEAKQSQLAYHLQAELLR